MFRDRGHGVVDVATAHREAVDEAQKHQPGLVLADIQLADNSSGIEAVQEILSETKVPVIFITAFPERLLTGDRPEPAFLLTKPYQPATLRAAISQVLRSEEPTSALQSLMRISYAVFCLNKKTGKPDERVPHL